MEYLELTGRFRNTDSATLELMRLTFKALLRSWGAVSSDDLGIGDNGKLPLWAEVEFLDNIVRFEMGQEEQFF